MAERVTSITDKILVEIRDALRAGFQRVDARIDHVIDLAGTAAREHEAWLRDHDVRIQRLERRPPRRRPDGPARRR